MPCASGFPVFTAPGPGGGSDGPIRARLVGQSIEICNDLGCVLVDLSPIGGIDSERQPIRLVGSILTIEDGNGAIVSSVDLADLIQSAIVNELTEDQRLTLTGNTLTLSDGNGQPLSIVTLPLTPSPSLTLSGGYSSGWNLSIGGGNVVIFPPITAIIRSAFNSQIPITVTP